MSILSDELTNDPNTTGYSGMTDAPVAEALNLSNIATIKSSLSGAEMLEAQDAAEFIALTDAKKVQWLALCGLGSIDPRGAAVDIVKDIWGNDSTTVSNLATLRATTISRAEELGISKVTIGQIQAERN